MAPSKIVPKNQQKSSGGISMATPGIIRGPKANPLSGIPQTATDARGPKPWMFKTGDSGALKAVGIGGIGYQAGGADKKLFRK